MNRRQLLLAAGVGAAGLALPKLALGEYGRSYRGLRPAYHVLQTIIANELVVRLDEKFGQRWLRYGVDEIPTSTNWTNTLDRLEFRWRTPITTYHEVMREVTRDHLPNAVTCWYDYLTTHYVPTYRTLTTGTFTEAHDHGSLATFRGLNVYTKVGKTFNEKLYIKCEMFIEQSDPCILPSHEVHSA